MSDITYTPYSKRSLLVHGDRNKYGNKLKEVGGRWNNRVKGEPGWTVPVEKEAELKKLISALKKEEKVELMSHQAKPNKEQSRYHRAVSDSEDSERDSDRSDYSERESERESEKIKPINLSPEKVREKSQRRSEVIVPIRSKSKPSRPIDYSSSEDEYSPPPRVKKHEYRKERREVLKSPTREKLVERRRESETRPEKLHRRRETPPREKYRDSRPLANTDYESRRTSHRDRDRDSERRDRYRHSPVRKRSPSLSESDSDFEESESDFPSPRTPQKKKTDYELEKDLHKKIKDLEKQVHAIKLAKRRERR